VSWLGCQKIAGLEYWVQLLLNFTPASVLKCKSGLNLSKVNILILSAKKIKTQTKTFIVLMFTEHDSNVSVY